MSDEPLVRLLARDLRSYLVGRGPRLDGPAYAVTLFTDYTEGVFCCPGVATETWYAAYSTSAANRSADRERLAGPSGARWDTAYWDIPADDFLSPETTTALAPLAAILIDTDHLVERDGELTLDDVARDAVYRWIEIGHQVILRADPLSVLPTVPDAIAYCEYPDGTAHERAEAMLHTVPLDRMRALFPEWEKLAEAVEAVRADPERMHELQDRAAGEWINGRWTGRELFPTRDEPLPDELTALLRTCNLTWQDVTTGSEDLDRALAVADRLSTAS